MPHADRVTVFSTEGNNVTQELDCSDVLATRSLEPSSTIDMLRTVL